MFQRLPCDAGVLLKLIVALPLQLAPGETIPRRVEFDLGVRLTIEAEAPYFRLLQEDDTVGYACLFDNGVGRMYVLPRLAAAFAALCAPCLCRAGHLLLARLRYSGMLTCSCKMSTLKCIFESAARTGHCPLTFLPRVPFVVVQEYAIASAEQRLRLSRARWLDCET
jgi:hypothetical protein